MPQMMVLAVIFRISFWDLKIVYIVFRSVNTFATLVTIFCPEFQKLIYCRFLLSVMWPLRVCPCLATRHTKL